MATHSSILAWRIPWTKEPGGLQSMGSLESDTTEVTSLSLFTFMHWRRKWQPTPVFLPGESQGLGSLVGCRLWGRTESDTTPWNFLGKSTGVGCCSLIFKCSQICKSFKLSVFVVIQRKAFPVLSFLKSPSGFLFPFMDSLSSIKFLNLWEFLLV